MAKRAAIHGEPPEGEAWCAGHQRFMPVTLFAKHRRDGYQRHCKECHRKYMKAWREGGYDRDTPKPERRARRANQRRGIVIGDRSESGAA
jgi:hypothetical protein